MNTDRRLKIHFICHALSGGGAERVMLLLAQGFSAHHHQVDIITFNSGSAYDLPPEVKHIKLHQGYFSNHTLRSCHNLLKFYEHRRNRPDVLISLMPRINLIAIVTAKIRRIKVIACEHNNYLSDNSQITRFTQKYVYRLADKLTVLTSFDIPFFKKNKVNATVMPNPSTFSTMEENRNPREKVILTVGSLNRVHQKGWDNLIDIVTPVLKEHRDWQLWIAGSGEKGEQIIREQLNNTEIANQIRLLGFRKDVNKLMQKADIFLMVSRFEGLPMVLIEAMSQKMCCISYDCITGPSEIISDGESGILVKNQDKKAMRLELHRLLSNDYLRSSLAEHAPQGLSKFELSNVLEKWETIFRELV